MPSALVLVVDRLGASCLGPYGNTWIDTPTFNTLACESLLAEWAQIASPDLAELYDGLWQGVPWPAYDPGCAAPVSLPAVLNRRAIPSQLVTDEPLVADLSAASEFDDQRLLELPHVNGPAAHVHDTALARFFAAGVEALQTLKESGLVWLHCRGMAGPWDAPAELRQQFADEGDPAPPELVDPPAMMLPRNHDPDTVHGIACAYAGQVALLDLCLDALLDVARGHPLADELLIAVAGGRGFPLGEHGCVGTPQTRLYRELVHIPCFLRRPGRLGSLHRQSRIAQPADLHTTLASWFGLEEGRTGCPLWTDERDPQHPAWAVSRHKNQWALRTPAWFARFADLRQSAEAHPKCELYVKPDDAWEVNDVADRCPEVALAVYQFVSRLSQHGVDARRVALPEILTQPID
jgi:arylsulfatase A-like enzyme